MQTWIAVDCNYLCHRAFYSTGGLSYRGIPTGVLFGFFSSLKKLKEEWLGGNGIFVFCFDSKNSLRKKSCAQYKALRKTTDTKEQTEARAILYEQIDVLRTKHLPMLGYGNVFMEDGYEADDLIASLVVSNPNKKDHEVVIVSSDQDLYQLLRSNVLIHDPRTNSTITSMSFSRDYKIKPRQWIEVKALAGCKSDNVQGIRGVGTDTAIKYIRGELPNGRVKERILSEEGQELYQRNLKLVQLPYRDCPPVIPNTLKEGCDSQWNRVMNSLGMKSLISGWENTDE